MEDNIAGLHAQIPTLEAKARLRVAVVEAAGWAISASILTLILVLVPREGGRILPHVFNVAHVALSAIVALVGYRVTRRVLAQLLPLPAWFPWFAGLAAVVILGGGLEIAQNFAPGQASWRDFAIDVMGGVAGLLLFVPPANVGFRIRGSWLKAAGVVVAAAAIAPSASAISNIIVRDRRFPEIVRFAPGYQPPFVYLRGGAKLSRVSPPREWSSVTDVVQLDLPRGGLAGISVTPPRGDWKPFKELVVPVYSSAERPVAVYVRVSDFEFKGHAQDMFRTEVTVLPGVNELRFSVAAIAAAPKGRTMALDRVGYVALLSTERAQPVELLLRPWRLE